MSWIMSSKPRPHQGVDFYIGAIKVCEVCFAPRATKWKFYLRIMGEFGPELHKPEFETMGEAMKEMHRLLNSPAPADNKVGRIFSNAP